MYKIVAEVLAKRIKKVLSRINDRRQSPFLGERILFHSVLIANEVVDETRWKNKQCLVFKIDYEKAYNLVF